MKILNLFLFMVMGLGAARASAETGIRFTNRELSAAFTLIRPELNTVEINGRTGVFSPSPALRYFGLAEQRFEISFSEVINLVDLQFDHLKSKALSIQFNHGSLELTVPLQDHDKVLKSRLGSLNIQGVSLVAVLGWVQHADGGQELVLKQARFNGTLNGTGLLKPQMILNKLRTLIVKTLSQQVTQILQNPGVQESIQGGLLNWAKFYTGVTYHSITPGSIGVFSETDLAGLNYSVQ